MQGPPPVQCLRWPPKEERLRRGLRWGLRRHGSCVCPYRSLCLSVSLSLCLSVSLSLSLSLCLSVSPSLRLSVSLSLCLSVSLSLCLSVSLSLCLPVSLSLCLSVSLSLCLSVSLSLCLSVSLSLCLCLSISLWYMQNAYHLCRRKHMIGLCIQNLGSVRVCDTHLLFVSHLIWFAAGHGCVAATSPLSETSLQKLPPVGWGKGQGVGCQGRGAEASRRHLLLQGRHIFATPY